MRAPLTSRLEAGARAARCGRASPEALATSLAEVPSAKRARIRANQERLRAERAARQRRTRLIRRGVIVLVILVALLALIYELTRPTAKPAKGLLANGCPNPNGSAPKRTHFGAYPKECLVAGDTYTATVDTTAGTFTFRLEPNLGPKSANAFYVLSLYHFYDGTTFFRVIPGFVIQGGSPTNTDTGSPGFAYADKNPPAGSYRFGTLAMANSGAPGTNGSQFFIVSGPAGEQLPPDYSVFGQVTSGLNVITTINDAGSAQNNGIPPKHTYRIVSIHWHIASS
ncbi:peptidyl-prolyl cis-trans isomerase cyclophilin type [Acidimicrobium ferrooxidans DSM 10331]|uniref:Peptidyl-prolyl cis-trans isomerase n=1 Tax=Acidimicrobium ferrooxidans (strain DSM 10331 / JCM 15462 / NBRC 103882 / ICP) TaxID=525909 RepID=C7M1N1_ACIFD|nr:peptidylprolyl isomerase [Acidimicrobium ferrooxidans]ACU53080.1 peptidyl-prolyl cis-trans isomerase cyclophilin type [Acidimicrobium ferrooxidans DSM 10331]